MFTKKILLVDQEPQLTLLVRQALERTGKYSIIEEHTTQRILETAHSFQPDLILIDLTTGGADGDFIAKQIRTDTILKDTPIVCLSSLRSGEAVASTGTLDGYSFSVTPVRIEELVGGVEELFFTSP